MLINPCYSEMNTEFIAGSGLDQSGISVFNCASIVTFQWAERLRVLKLAFWYIQFLSPCLVCQLKVTREILSDSKPKVRVDHHLRTSAHVHLRDTSARRQGMGSQYDARHTFISAIK